MKCKFFYFMEAIFFDASMWLQNVSSWFGDKAMYKDTELQKRIWEKYNKLVAEGKIHERL